MRLRPHNRSTYYFRKSHNIVYTVQPSLSVEAEANQTMRRLYLRMHRRRCTLQAIFSESLSWQQ
jgi:hypothetical protein